MVRQTESTCLSTGDQTDRQVHASRPARPMYSGPFATRLLRRIHSGGYRTIQYAEHAQSQRFHLVLARIDLDGCDELDTPRNLVDEESRPGDTSRHDNGVDVSLQYGGHFPNSLRDRVRHCGVHQESVLVPVVDHLLNRASVIRSEVADQTPFPSKEFNHSCLEYSTQKHQLNQPKAR